MTTKKKIVWRLSKLPTPDEVSVLLKDGVLTKDEAREILFSHETEEERDTKSLEAEIKFLRELVEKLSTNRSNIIETIRYVEKPYYNNGWFKPYAVYCSTNNDLTSGTANTVYLASGSGTSSATTLTYSGTPDAFSKIKTF